jgi:hypothetical protein
MKRLVWSALGAAATLSVWVGCHESSPTLAKAPIQTAALPSAPPPPLASAAASVTPSKTSPCAAVDTENHAAFEGALAKWDEASFSDGGTAQYAEILPNPCISAGNGAWSIALESFTSYRYPSFEATWGLVHVDLKGGMARYREDDSNTFTAGAGGAPYGPTKFWAFDFDDDGDAEVLFTYDLERVETAEVLTMFAYQFKNGTIKPYVPVPGWNDLDDVDNDGRPDALVVHNSEDYGGCGSYESETLLAPTLVAHSIQGGFSTTDDVAKRAARKACPKRPASVVELDGKLVDEGTTAKNVICARVWGASEAAVVHEIDMHCHPMICNAVASRPRTTGECMHLPTLIEWAKQPPIVSLP